VDPQAGRDDRESEIHEEAADDGQVRQAAGRRLDALVAYIQSLK
jgi:hypothetical protein